MTSSNENNFRALLALCKGKLHIPEQRAMTRSFDVFIDQRLNKRLGKQSICHLFMTPLCSLWHHSNASEKMESTINTLRPEQRSVGMFNAIIEIEAPALITMSQFSRFHFSGQWYIYFHTICDFIFYHVSCWYLSVSICFNVIWVSPRIQYSVSKLLLQIHSER